MKKEKIYQATKSILILCLFFASTVSAQKLSDKINAREQFGGKESNLQDKKVKEIVLTNSPTEKATPGSTVSIGMTAILEDGKEMKTKGFADGKVKWGNYIVRVSGGSFNDGYVTIDKDPRKIPGYKVSVKVALYSDTTRFKTLEFKVGFNTAYIANYSGKNGDVGKQGAKGRGGNAGNSNTSAGGRGEDGGDGGDGENGGDGRDGETGETVEVYMTAFKSETGETLLKVYVKSKTQQHEDFYIIDPKGGGLTILVKGGNGGSGGHGGEGGQGGTGGYGNSTDGTGGDGGDGGNTGSGGDGGNGGNGGSVTLYVDPSAKAYSSLIKCENDGGSPGSMGTAYTANLTGGSSGGAGKYPGKTGKTGQYGVNGVSGKYSGKKGPVILVITQASGIDWDTVGTKN